MDSTPLRLLATVVLPLWLLAGWADWGCHRAARIELTSGSRESLLHLVQLAEIGVVIIAALFLEANGALVLLAVAMIVAHEITAWIDLTYADSRRRITPVEQMVHSVLEILPLAALLLLLAHWWPDVDALGAALADLTPRPADHPIPGVWLAGLAFAIGMVGMAPYGEELWRCVRVERSR